MQIGMIGLGRMGANMARRLTKGGHECVVYDRSAETVDALAKEGPTGAHSLAEVVEKLSTPRAVWIMLPSGVPTEETVVTLSKLLTAGDAIIDGAAVARVFPGSGHSPAICADARTMTASTAQIELVRRSPSNGAANSPLRYVGIARSCSFSSWTTARSYATRRRRSSRAVKTSTREWCRRPSMIMLRWPPLGLRRHAWRRRSNAPTGKQPNVKSTSRRSWSGSCANSSPRWLLVFRLREAHGI